jgi:protein SCO1/2
MTRVPRAALYLVLLGALVLPAPAGQDLPEGLRDVGIDAHVGQTLPLDAEFVDEAGHPVQLGHYFGQRPVILVFAYYRCPMLCTEVLNGLVSALRPSLLDVGRELDVVVVSIDPRERAPAAWLKKKNYVDDYGRPATAAGWHFLTGKEPAIEQVTQAGGYRFRYDRDRDQFAHASAILVVTPQGKVARYFYGIAYDPVGLQNAVLRAAVLPEEAQLGRALAAGPLGPLHVLATLRRPPAAGQPAAFGGGFVPAGQAAELPTLLYCFQYDPVTGRVTLLTMRALRVAGVLCVVGLAIGAMWMQRRVRRRAVDRLQTTG